MKNAWFVDFVPFTNHPKITNGTWTADGVHLLTSMNYAKARIFMALLHLAAEQATHSSFHGRPSPLKPSPLKPSPLKPSPLKGPYTLIDQLQYPLSKKLRAIPIRVWSSIGLAAAL